jgi:hypothetical protein
MGQARVDAQGPTAACFASTTVRYTTVDQTLGKRELMRRDLPSARPWFSKKRQAWGKQPPTD